MTNNNIISDSHRQIATKLAEAFMRQDTMAAGVTSFSEDDAFSIKRAMFRALKTMMADGAGNMRVLGRKIGRNDKVGLIATPIYHQGDAGRHPLPANLIGLEPELAVIWGDHLPPRIKNEKDFYRALADSGARLALGIEILANRFRLPALPWDDKTRPDFSLILADHLHQWGYVVAEERMTIEVERDYHQEPFSFRYGDKVMKAAGAKLAFGNPLNMLWQFYQTRPFNPLTETEQFKKGEVITLGCLFGAAVPLVRDDMRAAGGKVVFEFPRFRPLEINFVG